MVIEDTQKLKLQIDLGNDAMLGYEELADALDNVAQRLRDYKDEGEIRDANGNTVGDYRIA